MIRSKWLILVALLTVSGCSTYKSSFNCGDARGAYCSSMEQVDQMINNGEIERYNEMLKNKKYKADKNDKSLLLNKKPKKVKINEAKDVSN